MKTHPFEDLSNRQDIIQFGYLNHKKKHFPWRLFESGKFELFIGNKWIEVFDLVVKDRFAQKAEDDTCPKCQNTMVLRKHREPLPQKLLKKKYHFLQWYFCKNCGHVQFYEKYKILHNHEN